MSDRHIRWLYGQLPELTRRGVVPAEVGERLRQHYGPARETDGKRVALVLFSLLGALLIGGGLILLIGHNWDQLSRPVRAALSFAPLVVAQAVAGWTLWQRPESSAWREGSGAFLTTAIGASIALVSQTYHIPGDLGAFMLTWSLLALPAAYLLRATVPVLFFLLGILVWAGDSFYPPERTLWFWLLLAAVVPFVWWTAREDRYHPRPVLVCWTLAICLSIGAGMSLHSVLGDHGGWILLYTSLFGGLYLAGARWWGDAQSFWQRPFQTVGALGGVGMALLLSFDDVWSPGRGSETAAISEHPVAWAILAVVVASALGLWALAFRRRAARVGTGALELREVPSLLLGALPVIGLVGVGAEQALGAGWGLLGMLLANLYLLVLGVGVLASGLRGERLGRVNAGMLILSAGIVARFIDADLSMLLRGIVFILLGTGFLVTNVVLTQRKGARA